VGFPWSGHNRFLSDPIFFITSSAITPLMLCNQQPRENLTINCRRRVENTFIAEFTGLSVTELLKLILNINGKFIIIHFRTLIDNSVNSIQQNTQIFYCAISCLKH
jgi:hypothetical protein